MEPSGEQATRPEPHHRRQRARVLPVHRRPARPPARAVQEPRLSRTWRWTGSARRAASTSPWAERPDGMYPGSDPELRPAGQLFEERGVDLAILHPMTRGLPARPAPGARPSLAAHNEMLVDRWLDTGTYAERFRGTIRVNPDDIDGRAEGDRALAGPPADRPDRPAAAVPRALRAAAVLAAVGGRRRRGPAGRGAHRDRAWASTTRLPRPGRPGPTAVRQLHGG